MNRLGPRSGRLPADSSAGEHAKSTRRSGLLRASLAAICPAAPNRPAGRRPATGPSGQRQADRRARAAASARLRTPSLASRFDTCTLTVFSLMNSCRAISRLLRPSTSRASTSRSRAVSASGPAGAAAAARPPDRGRAEPAQRGQQRRGPQPTGDLAGRGRPARPPRAPARPPAAPRPAGPGSGPARRPRRSRSRSTARCQSSIRLRRGRGAGRRAGQPAHAFPFGLGPAEPGDRLDPEPAPGRQALGRARAGRFDQLGADREQLGLASAAAPGPPRRPVPRSPAPRAGSGPGTSRPARARSARRRPARSRCDALERPSGVGVQIDRRARAQHGEHAVAMPERTDPGHQVERVELTASGPHRHRRPRAGRPRRTAAAARRRSERCAGSRPTRPARTGSARSAAGRRTRTPPTAARSPAPGRRRPGTRRAPRRDRPGRSSACRGCSGCAARSRYRRSRGPARSTSAQPAGRLDRVAGAPLEHGQGGLGVGGDLGLVERVGQRHRVLAPAHRVEIAPQRHRRPGVHASQPGPQRRRRVSAGSGAARRRVAP